MIRQKSFDNDKATLYLVATPIGNLSEMSPRAIETLKNVDIIAAEDTRMTQKLLTHFDIHTRLIAHHQHNEHHSARGILNLLDEGKNIALVSDAGYPLLCDPGQNVVEKASQAGYNVVAISGANAMLNALVVSGLVVMPFYFKGFLSSNSNALRKECEALKELPCTIIFYEAPHRIKKTLSIFLEVFKDRELCLARELTKKHEEIIRGKISEILAICEELKGEMVLVLSGAVLEEKILTEEEIKALVIEKVNLGLSVSAAIKEVAKNNNISKNEVYHLFHKER